jgi:predicted Zn-dependent peptidase
MREFGVLGVSAQTGPDTTGEVWRLLDELLREAAEKGFGVEETAAARAAEINRTIFRYRDPEAAVVRRASLWLDNLPLDLDEQFSREIAGISATEVNRAEGAHLRPDAGVWVLVGPVDPNDSKWAGRGRVTVIR